MNGELRHNIFLAIWELSEMKNASSKKSKSAFGDLGDMISAGGLENIFAIAGSNKATFSFISAEDIHILPQQRDADEMETEEQKIDELAESIKAEGLIAPIVLVLDKANDGSWRLICGERRVRACALIGHNPIEAMCYESLTDEQIERIQFAENTHRLNLSQINEAKVLKRDIHNLGSIEAVMDFRKKSRSWISKRLSILELPKETTRLLTESITADLEVINTVKQIEKINPEVAAATVIELKSNLGKKGVNARDTANNAKNQVKPPKKEKPKIINPENVAKPKDTSFMDAGEVVQISPEVETTDILPTKNDFIEKVEEQQNLEFVTEVVPIEKLLNNIYDLIYISGNDTKSTFESLPIIQKEAVSDWLRDFYEAGIACKNIGNAVIQGFRTGKFSSESYTAFALVAFLNGAEEGMQFNALNIIGTMKN